MLDETHITTIAACSTALAVIMCIAILLSFYKNGRAGERWWLFLPFGLAVPSSILLTWPDLLPGGWGLQLGWLGLTLTYGGAWTAARVTLGRPARPLVVLLPCLAALLFNTTIGMETAWPELRMLPRILLFGLFNALAAREFWRPADHQPQSATTLRWIFTTFAVIDLARTPLAVVLPAPFGSSETQLWSIALFNFAVVLEGLLLGVFLTALRRELIAARHLRLAMVDPLTGVGNRRALDAAITRLEAEPPAQNGGMTAVAMFDIDRFKLVNDELGHPFGDLVIAGAAHVAGELFGNAQVYRTGGEEFVVLYRAATMPAALQQAEKLRKAFADRSHRDKTHSRRCTISVGVALARPGLDAKALLASADEALYAAKRGGRNRTIIAGMGTPVAVAPATVPAGAEHVRPVYRRRARRAALRS
ncbi:GGDEF domain-containing protein [Croceibacterium ferulae]|uniref:GGDEF domain-containing protein n=1 Tax=Croceibacterium ferulae TaxID=1854641 RepID=UPI000EAE4617|nr:GGDEF domain-containing protein [Croceibacterium ferulae]